MVLLFCTRVQNAFTRCCFQFSKARPSYIAQSKYVQIVVPEFPGDVSSLSYLIKCSHVPTPKSQGTFGCHEGSPRRLIRLRGSLRLCPAAVIRVTPEFQLRKLSSGGSHVARRHPLMSSSILFSVSVIIYFYRVPLSPNLEDQ